MEESNLARFRRGLDEGPSSEIVAALKREFGDDANRVVSFLGAQAKIGAAHHGLRTKVAFWAGCGFGAAAVVIVALIGVLARALLS